MVYKQTSSEGLCPFHSHWAEQGLRHLPTVAVEWTGHAKRLSTRKLRKMFYRPPYHWEATPGPPTDPAESRAARLAADRRGFSAVAVSEHREQRMSSPDARNATPSSSFSPRGTSACSAGSDLATLGRALWFHEQARQYEWPWLLSDIEKQPCSLFP